MAADVDDVVNAAHEPEVAVGVLAGAVSGEITAFDVAPVGLAIALMVAVDGAGHRGPWLADDEQAAMAGRDVFSLLVDHLRLNAKEGPRGRAGLGGHGAGKGSDQNGASLGLPPGIDDGAAVVADL